MKKYKLLIAAAAVAVGVAGAGLLPNAVTAKAGSSEVYIASSTSIDDTSVNSGDFLATGKVAAENGKAKLMSPVFFFLRKSQVKILVNGKSVDFCFEKNMKNTDMSDFMPSFDFDGQAENGIAVVINSKEYKCG